MQNQTLDQAIAKTDELLKRSRDPAMVDIRKQLTLMKSGQNKNAIGRMITMNYTPAPTPEIQEWADLVLKAWHERQ